MNNSTCQKCGKTPNKIQAPRAFYFWPPQGHTETKIQSVISSRNSSIPAPGGLGIKISDDAKALISKLRETLTDLELAETRCLVKEDDTDLSVDDIANIGSAKQLFALLEADEVISIIDDDRISTFFQPIVQARQTNVPYAHECLMRVANVDGGYLNPAALFDTARDADLIFPLDRAARETHIRSASRQVAQTKFFINFMPTAIYDPKNCLRTTFNAIHQFGMQPNQFVFEVVESEKIDDPNHLKSILRYYQHNGFEVALDDLGSGHATLSLLGELKPNYVKLDMELVRDVHKDPYKSELVKHIIELAHTFNIKVVAEGIEVLEESAYLVSQNVDYLQGYYFAKPAEASVERVERRRG